MENARILLLSQEVIGQIAAGEVVERPSAAIKELVENSLDAGATSVTVDIKGGGVDSLRVTDNGKGIDPSDIRMAFERHATSKIRTAKDLYSVETLGFRGEALASIAAVAHVRCTSRARGRDTGLTLQNDGGVISGLTEAACPEGTTFLVKDLFYNAPVRRKFLKKASVETSYVSELMARLILSHPEISFRYLADGKSIYFSAGDGKLESAVLSVYGMDVLRLMTPVSGNMNGVLLNGFVGVGDVARGNRNYESFFLNGRAMKSPLLSSAVENACRQRVTIGKFPMCILHLTMPFDAADVNVHPNKWEVRFQNEQGVREAVETIVLDALLSLQHDALTAPRLFDHPLQASRLPDASVSSSATVPKEPIAAAEITNDKEKANGTAPQSFVPSVAQTPVSIRRSAVVPVSLPSAAASPNVKIPAFHEREYTPPYLIKSDLPADTTDNKTAPAISAAADQPAMQTVPAINKAEPSTILPPAQVADAALEQHFEEEPPRLIGVVFNTYIILEYKDQMLLCDQHAAHERLLYERFMRETARSGASQTLMIPQAVKLSHTEYAVFEDNQEILQKTGFDVSPFGDDTVQLRGVPTILGQPEAESCFRDSLDILTVGNSADLTDKTQRIIQMACKHAVKGGEKVPPEELIDLIHQILAHNLPPTCPHGRPLMMTLTREELEKRFRRIQS